MTMHIYETVSNAEGSRIVPGITLFAAGTPTGFDDTKYGTASTAIPMIVREYDEEKYNPEMVDRLLQLDVEKPEAKFNNVIDMMDWLSSDD